ncbi:MAG: hypothetical protein ACRENI_03020 [Gemmatimonadaceae bacterium]
MSHRVFHDADGREWQVWDVVPSKPVGHTLEGGWLAFESLTERRRLTPLPLYWAKASDDELERLLQQARPVTGRHPPQMPEQPGEQPSKQP